MDPYRTRTVIAFGSVQWQNTNKTIAHERQHNIPSNTIMLSLLYLSRYSDKATLNRIHELILHTFVSSNCTHSHLISGIIIEHNNKDDNYMYLLVQNSAGGQ